MGFWTWLRAKAREATLAGIGDALEELEAGDGETPVAPLALLRSRLQPALPAPEEGKRGRKRED